MTIINKTAVSEEINHSRNITVREGFAKKTDAMLLKTSLEYFSEINTINVLVTTQGGYLRLQKRLQVALDTATANAKAATEDNVVWRDDFACEQNQRRIHKQNYQINELKAQLAKVRIIVAPQAPTKVQVGCVVTLRDELENKQWIFEVAGYEDGDIREGRVSYTSSVIQKIIGGMENEEYELFLDGEIRDVIIHSIKAQQTKRCHDYN